MAAYEVLDEELLEVGLGGGGGRASGAADDGALADAELGGPGAGAVPSPGLAASPPSSQALGQ